MDEAKDDSLVEYMCHDEEPGGMKGLVKYMDVKEERYSYKDETNRQRKKH